MEQQIDCKKNYIGIDLFRIIAVLLVIMNHTYPLANINETADFILTRIIARVAVPFFFMVSGYFSVSTIINNDNRNGLKKSISKMCKLYLIATIIYLPINIYNGRVSMSTSFIKIVEDIVFNGTFYHLWYLPAAIIGMLIVSFLLGKFKVNTALIISLLFYIVGLLGDSYYYVFSSIPLIDSVYQFIFSICEYTRNGVFMAPIFLLMGGMIARQKKTGQAKYISLGFILSILLMVVEGLMLYKNNLQRHSSMYVMLLPTVYFLFELLLQCSDKISCNSINVKRIRNISMTMYIIHPLVIIFIRGIAKGINLQKMLVDNNLINFLFVTCISLAISTLYYYTNYRIRTKKDI